MMEGHPRHGRRLPVSFPQRRQCKTEKESIYCTPSPHSSSLDHSNSILLVLRILATRRWSLWRTTPGPWSRCRSRCSSISAAIATIAHTRRRRREVSRRRGVHGRATRRRRRVCSIAARSRCRVCAGSRCVVSRRRGSREISLGIRARVSP